MPLSRPTCWTGPPRHGGGRPVGLVVRPVPDARTDPGEGGGEAPGVELVKVDVDANPRSAATFQVQSIPAVYAIRDRKVVDSFIGALPEPAVRQWVAGLTRRRPRSTA